MTAEQDREDLAHHEDEITRHASFNYALFDPGETELLGCVYIDPPEKSGADAEISWWVVNWLVGTPVGGALDAFVPEWVARDWPLAQRRYVGRDISWAEWIALPGCDGSERPATGADGRDAAGPDGADGDAATH